MKTSLLLNVLLALALVALTVKLVKQSHTSGGDVASVVMDNILSRTSIRSYTDKTVDKDIVEKLLRAGMAAPTAANKQPWHFVVIDDKTTLQQLAEATPNARMTANAPLAIVVCGDLTKALEGQAREFWVQDVSAATENILLAAHAMGLGAVWCGNYPATERVQAISQLLNLPENLVPLSTIVVGYPSETPEPKNKWNEANISYNAYGLTDSKAAAATLEEPAKREFKEFDVDKEFRGNPFNFFKGHGLLLAAGDKNGYNEMTIGWGALGNIWGKGCNTITVYVAPARYTHEFMEKTKYFTVMVFDKDQESVLDYMGTKSGRDEDKAKSLGLTTRFTENGTPYFEEASEVYECEMIYHAPFNPETMGDVPTKFYEHFEAGIHSLYMGKIVKAMRK